MTFEWRLEGGEKVGQAGVWLEGSRRGGSSDKGPETGACLVVPGSMESPAGGGVQRDNGPGQGAWENWDPGQV